MRQHTNMKMASVTVVIPAFNEAANIANLTHQVLSELWTKRLYLDKIIIVDDGSDDGTRAITDRLQLEDNRVCVIRHAQRYGKNHGVREGIAASKSHFTAFLDADILLAPGCLTATISLLVNEPSLAAVSCISDPLPARTWRERASRFQAVLITELRRMGQDSLLRVWAIRTPVLADLTLPDDVADDQYIMCWLRHHGYSYALHPDVASYFKPAVGLRDFAKQTVRTRRGVQDIDRIFPPTPTTNRRRIIRRALAQAVLREPLGFLLYLAWRSIIAVTPTKFWLPSVALSKHSVSTSTKDLS